MMNSKSLVVQLKGCIAVAGEEESLGVVVDGDDVVAVGR